jgi:nucleotide-binding universal stress UspA family protein
MRARGPADAAIFRKLAATKSDLIMLGGYGLSPLLEVMWGSAIDPVLQNSQVPVLIST